MSAAGIEVDKGSGLFQHIGQMQEWRNLVTHASPYEVEPTEIPDTVQAPHKLHQKRSIWTMPEWPSQIMPRSSTRLPSPT